jgi:hypothetical protein
MPRFLFLLFVCLVYQCPSLAQPNILKVEEININSSKRNVEEFVVHKVRNYYDINADNCWKIIKKKRGINLGKKTKRQEFLNSLEDEIRAAFTRVNTVGEIDLYKKYGVFISNILGRHVKAHQFNATPGKSNPASFDIGFFKEKVQYFSVGIQLVNEYHTWSGYPYNTSQVALIKQQFVNPTMSFNHQSSRTSTNACSEREEPNYRETFTAYKKGYWNQSYTYTFGPYTQRINSYTCRYTGNNHLTDINIFITNERL